MLSPEEKMQYSRQLSLHNIGLEGQLKLQSAKVLVIGAGGLGCPILQYLTAAGIGTIGIIDNDYIAQSNLQRQILFTHQDIGKPKAKIAADRLARTNPYVHFEVVLKPFCTENAIALCKSYDILVDGSDNFATRYLINDACVLTDRPFVFGSIHQYEGQLAVCNHHESATYRCLYPEVLSNASIPNCSEAGVLGVLPGVIGSMQANEVIKLITGIGSPLKNKLLVWNALSLEQNIFSFSRNQNISIERLAVDYTNACLTQNDVSVSEVKEIDFGELQANRSKYTILDVRSVTEFAAYNIGGLHIPLDRLDAELHTFDTKNALVLCCKSGIRSKKAAEMIQRKRKDLEIKILKNGLLNHLITK